MAPERVFATVNKLKSKFGKSILSLSVRINTLELSLIKEVSNPGIFSGNNQRERGREGIATSTRNVCTALGNTLP